MTVLLLFTQIYFNKIIYNLYWFLLAHVRVIHGISRQSRYLANVAYDVTMCLCIYYGHYLNTG